LPPIDVEQLLVGNLRWIVCDFDRFSIPSFLGRHKFVSGAGFSSAAIPHDCFDYAIRFVEGRLDTPETAARENCGPRLSRREILSQSKIGN